MSDKGFGLSVEGECMECLTLFQILGIFLSSQNKVCKEYLGIVPGLFVKKKNPLVEPFFQWMEESNDFLGSASGFSD